MTPRLGGLAPYSPPSTFFIDPGFIAAIIRKYDSTEAPCQIPVSYPRELGDLPRRSVLCNDSPGIPPAHPARRRKTAFSRRYHLFKPQSRYDERNNEEHERF